MWNSGKKFRALRYKKKIFVLSEKKILNETKNHKPPPPPFKLNGRSLTIFLYINEFLLKLSAINPSIIHMMKVIQNIQKCLSNSIC
jgi:hypothetical protein